MGQGCLNRLTSPGEGAAGAARFKPNEPVLTNDGHDCSDAARAGCGRRPAEQEPKCLVPFGFYPTRRSITDGCRWLKRSAMPNKRAGFGDGCFDGSALGGWM